MTKKDLSRRLSAFRDKRLFDISSVSWRCSKEEQVKFPFHYLRFPAFFRSFLLLLFFSFLLDQKVSCLDLIGLALKIWQDNWIKSLKTSFQNIHTERERERRIYRQKHLERKKGSWELQRIYIFLSNWLFFHSVQDDSSGRQFKKCLREATKSTIPGTHRLHILYTWTDIYR